MTRAKRSSITIQNVNRSSQVTYILPPPLGMKLRERLQNMKRYFPVRINKESNRTAWPPFRVVGSHSLLYHVKGALSIPLSRYQASARTNLCYFTKRDPRISTFCHAKVQIHILQLSQKYSIIILLFGYCTVFLRSFCISYRMSDRFERKI